MNYVKKNALLSLPCTLFTRCLHILTSFFLGIHTDPSERFSCSKNRRAENRNSFIIKDIGLVYIMFLIGSKISPLKTRTYKACFGLFMGFVRKSGFLSYRHKIFTFCNGWKNGRKYDFEPAISYTDPEAGPDLALVSGSNGRI